MLNKQYRHINVDCFAFRLLKRQVRVRFRGSVLDVGIIFLVKFALVAHEFLEMDCVVLCEAGRSNDILEGTDHLIVRCDEASKSGTDLKM